MLCLKYYDNNKIFGVFYGGKTKEEEMLKKLRHISYLIPEFLWLAEIKVTALEISFIFLLHFHNIAKSDAFNFIVNNYPAIN